MNLKRKSEQFETEQGPKAPSDTEVLRELMNGPKNTVSVAESLPEAQRARIAQFCYQRVHMRELGLRLAAGCNLHTLRAAFGRAGDVVYAQSRDVDKTMGSLKSSHGSQLSKPITLKTTILDKLAH